MLCMRELGSSSILQVRQSLEGEPDPIFQLSRIALPCHCHRQNKNMRTGEYLRTREEEFFSAHALQSRGTLHIKTRFRVGLAHLYV